MLRVLILAFLGIQLIAAIPVVQDGNRLPSEKRLQKRAIPDHILEILRNWNTGDSRTGKSSESDESRQPDAESHNSTGIWNRKGESYDRFRIWWDSHGKYLNRSGLWIHGQKNLSRDDFEALYNRIGRWNNSSRYWSEWFNNWIGRWNKTGSVYNRFRYWDSRDDSQDRSRDYDERYNLPTGRSDSADESRNRSRQLDSKSNSKDKSYDSRDKSQKTKSVDSDERSKESDSESKSK